MIPCVGLITVLEMLPRAGHSQSRLLDQLGQFPFGILKAESTSCPGSEGPRASPGCAGRAVTSENSRAAPALGAPTAPGLCPGHGHGPTCHPGLGDSWGGTTGQGMGRRSLLSRLVSATAALGSAVPGCHRDRPVLCPRVLAGPPALPCPQPRLAG